MIRGDQNSGFHSVNEFEGHVGKQAGVLAHTGVSAHIASRIKSDP